MIGIYKITSPTGRVYIGQSIDIERRFKQYSSLSSVKSSVKLYRSLLKYGWSGHKSEVIDKCEAEQLNNRERFYQELYNATSEENLNCILTETDCKKRVIRKMTDKQKAQISKTHKGKVYSEETRQKIRVGRAKQIITEEHKRKISENSGSARLVLDLVNGIFYRTIKEASFVCGMSPNSLHYKLAGKHITNNTNLVFV